MPTGILEWLVRLGRYPQTHLRNESHAGPG
jgi:hypothetical protein